MEEISRTPKLDFWVQQVNAYEKEAKNWEARSKKIVKRYRDTRPDNEKNVSRFNILWSNVQTLHPALYSGTPTPNVDRRYDDDGEINTTVAQILERGVTSFVKTNDFDDCMNQAVLDRLLSGRGTVWVRYVPNFKDVEVQGLEEVKAEGSQVTDDVMIGDDVAQELYSEDVVLDYVHWQDFGHCVSRTWQENRAVWRRVYLSKKECKERFGRDDIPLDAKPMGKADEDRSDEGNRACIYELWDKVTKTAYWFHKEMEDFLDEVEDPLRLKGFFPCPKPVYSTVANDSLIPTPDFVLYQTQAIELDTLTARIESLTRALKVVGVYDSSAEGVQRMLSENVDNMLIPVEQWAMFAEKGGLNGVVNFMPIQEVGAVLMSLYDARERAKQSIYEITGISDIVRGSTNANETATAQQIKGQFATLRLDAMQKDVNRFSRDAVRMMTEVIAEHFSIDTIKQISGVKLLTEQEKMQIQMMMQAQQQGQQVPPIPEETIKLLKKPTWEQVEAILREDGARCFRIDIQTDSTIKADQEAEKQARVEFLTAAGGFIQQAAQIQAPELQPLLMEMLKFGISGFKAGREMETEFKVALDGIKQKAEQPQEQQPDPAIAQAQADMQAKQAEMQGKMQLEGQKMQMEQERAGAEVQLKQQELMLKDREIALKEAQLGLEQQKNAEQIQLERDKIQAEIVKAVISKQEAPESPDISQVISQAFEQMTEIQGQTTQAIVDALQKPKTVVRDKQGKVLGIQ